jgi:hypothetical protein
MANDDVAERTAHTHRIATMGAVALLSVGLLGCPNPNTYGTPRTTPKGKIQHTVALEAMRLSGDVITAQTDPNTGNVIRQREEQSLTFPTFPTYQLRVGVGDRVDIGARIANLSSFGADVKWNFLKSQGFDMAIDPGLQAFYIASSGGSAFIGYAHLPLLLGFNLSDDVTLVASPGAVVSFASGSSNDDDGRSALSSTAGIWARFGLGLNIRTSKKFALHPEITGMRAFTDESTMLILFGIGFNFGNLPDYSPGSENDEYEEEPRPAPAESEPMGTVSPAVDPNAPPPVAPADPAGDGT